MLRSWLSCVIQTFVVVHEICLFYGLCIATYSFYCFWIVGFVTFSSPFLMQDFEEQPTHGTHPFHAVPDSKSQDLVSFLGLFSIRDSLLLLWLLDTLGGFFVLFISPTFVLYCAYQTNFLLWCFFLTYVVLVLKCSFVPLEQGSSSEQTYRWHPEAHLLERSTAVPVRTLQNFVLRTVEYVFGW